jgi:phosphoserine phosphatase
MTLINEKNEQFTGLILLTGLDSPGLANALFETLTPFAVSIIDIDQIIINKRLILTVHIALNPSHQGAIESDLEALISTQNVDIASVFAFSQSITARPKCEIVLISSSKMHPRYLASVTACIKELSGNIEDINRKGVNPVEIVLYVSGVESTLLDEYLQQVPVEGETTIAVVK